MMQANVKISRAFFVSVRFCCYQIYLIPHEALRSEVFVRLIVSNRKLANKRYKNRTQIT